MCSTCEGDDWFYAVSTGNCNGPVLTVHTCSWKKKGWFTLGNGHRISLYLCSFPVAWMSVPNQAGSSVSIERTQKMVPCAKCIQFPTWYFGGYPVVSHIYIYIYIVAIPVWLMNLPRSRWIFLDLLGILAHVRLHLSTFNPPAKYVPFPHHQFKIFSQTFPRKDQLQAAKVESCPANCWGPWRWPPSWHEEHSWGSLPLV